MKKRTATKETQIKAINWILGLRTEMRNLIGHSKKNYHHNAYLSQQIDLKLEKIRHELQN